MIEIGDKQIPEIKLCRKEIVLFMTIRRFDYEMNSLIMNPKVRLNAGGIANKKQGCVT